MAVVVYSEPRQRVARGVKEMGLRNEGKGKSLVPACENQEKHWLAKILGGREDY